MTTIKTLCDSGGGTEPCQWFVGFGDTLTGPAQQDGIGLVYNPVTALAGAAISTKWQLELAAGGARTYLTLDGTNNTVDSPVQVGDISAASGTVYDVKITVTGGAAGAGRADWCLQSLDATSPICTATSSGHVASACSSGCSVLATNIPAPGNAQTFGLLNVINKTAGTATQRIVEADGVGVFLPFLPAR